jgi:Linalool dehydratase/isomerase
MTTSVTREINERGRGWLRFIWDKATTPDDWSSKGEPLAWWDRDSTAPMCTFPRFDLGETAYALPVYADITPAWREVYTRIADELVGRHTTFWAAIDWLTLIGHDPAADQYPPEWLAFLPERLRGKYDPPGWTANGVAPWGLQPDPIGADGNLFFRGFFNLLLSAYAYVSGDAKWQRPFEMTGYQDRRFRWTHHEIAEFIHMQWKDRPQGPNCENTKIWPFCVSGAGLGLQLYDKVYGKQYHGVYDDWVEFAKKHYMRLDGRGRLEAFAFYYDPLEDEVCTFPNELTAYAAICITPYLLPQNRAFGEFLYEQSVSLLGWNDPKKPLLNLATDPRFLSVGQLIAREVGDSTTERRLRDYAERKFEPRVFGEENDRFGWWFGRKEPYPRGQLSALQMLCELGDPGAWSRVFDRPNLAKFDEPTVVGVDYPSLGICEAWNDGDSGDLRVATYAATPSRRGAHTSFRVTKLPNVRAVRVRCDGVDDPPWRAVGDDTIEIECDIGEHRFEIATRGQARDDASEQRRREGADAEIVAKAGSESRTYVPAPPPTCAAPCCGTSEKSS